jgi:hypothetical protein
LPFFRFFLLWRGGEEGAGGEAGSDDRDRDETPPTRNVVHETSSWKMESLT